MNDMRYTEAIGYVYSHLKGAAIFEQLAEECAELTQAALKTARILRKENPTPVAYVEALKNIDEEVNDVLVCMDALRLYPDRKYMLIKAERWMNRLKDQCEVEE